MLLHLLSDVLLSVLCAGALSEEAATPALNSCLQGLYAALANLPPVVGTVTVRLEVAGLGGRVTGLRWLVHTLVARPQGGLEPWEAPDATLATIAEHLVAATFPECGGDTAITLPFVFE